MAEIKIEKKKPVWPWIVAVIIILFVIYFFWSSNYDKRRGGTQEINFQDSISMSSTELQDEATSFYQNPNAFLDQLQDYSTFLSDSELHQENTASYFHRNALLKLIKATREQAVTTNIDVTRNLEIADENALKVTHDVHNAAGYQIKKAASEITEALTKIQKDHYEDLHAEIKALERDITDMNGMRAIDEQQESILSFHRHALDLLQKMGLHNPAVKTNP